MGVQERRVAGTAGVSPAPADRAAGWRSRLYLPHFDQPGVVQTITFRLADSLPTHVVEEIERDPRVRTDAYHRQGIELGLDAGHGSCRLGDPRIAQLVQDALLYFDGVRYRLFAWVVMPNHVHVLIEPSKGCTVSNIVQSWKSFTAKKANELLGRTGAFWWPEYFDRAIRDERHFGMAITYIHENPVKAGLVRSPPDWPYSSTARRWNEWEAGETPAVPANSSLSNLE
jgi:REP element-mobilizing transposase RayT